MTNINKTNHLLFFVIVLAFVLRTLFLSDNLFFGWEQGRDFLKLAEIKSGNHTLVGPKTDIDGVFHGSLSYYIPLVPYLVFNGSPYWVLMIYIAFNSLSILALYKTTEEMFSKRVAIFSSLFYSLSYSSIIYARWLSNPSLVPALTIFFFYFLWRSKKDWRYLFLSLICWLTIFHLIVVVAISLIIPGIYLIVSEKVKLTVGRSVMLGTLVPVFFSSYILFESKNNFIMTKSFFASDQASGKFWLSGIGFIDQFINEVVDGIAPLSPRLGFIVFTALVIFLISHSKEIKRSGIILTFLFSVPILFLFVSNSPLRHFFIATPIFLSMALGVASDSLLGMNRKLLAYSLVTLVFLGNLLAIMKRLPESEGNFIHHAQRTYLSDMTDLIDYAYEDADGKEFTYDYYSMPYWKEDAWIYLFQWYGKNKYGYAPAVDRTNVDRSEIFYTFIEPNETAKIHQDNWYGEYKKDSELLDIVESGKLKVEKRKMKEAINPQ